MTNTVEVQVKRDRAGKIIEVNGSKVFAGPCETEEKCIAEAAGIANVHVVRTGEGLLYQYGQIEDKWYAWAKP